MEHTEKNMQKIDLVPLLMNLWTAVKRIWIIGILLVAICATGFMLVSRWRYVPVYEAYASFTVKVVSPLYSAANGYNAQTAEQMEKTFPYILSSNALRERVKEYLDVSYLPTVTAETIEGTNVFTLRVRDTNAQQANDVLNAVIACYPSVSEFVIGPTNMVLLDESGVPVQPINSYSWKSSAVIGAVVGVVLWLFIGLVIAVTRNTIHDEDELKDLLNRPCLGALPVTKVVGKGASHPLMHQNHGKYGFGEATRLTCLHVEKELKQRKKRVLLISSAAPGEGKTTVSTNLAISLAQRGKRVLLVDCDLRNPSVAKAFQIEQCEGLSNYLEGRATAKEIIKSTSVKGLFVIVGGQSKTENPADLLFNNRLRRLVEASKNVFDYIIFDTSPCGLLADASEVAELAECALMVVRQNYASRNQILDGARYLTDSKIPLIGAVLNGTKGSGRYGYGYGYSYGNH